MSNKDFWKDKWQNNQYNKRNPGQENHPESPSTKVTPPPAAPQKERAPEKKK